MSAVDTMTDAELDELAMALMRDIEGLPAEPGDEKTIKDFVARLFPKTPPAQDEQPLCRIGQGSSETVVMPSDVR